MRKLSVLMLTAMSLALAQEADFGALQRGGDALFNFARTGIKLILVGAYLGAFAFGIFMVVKKTRAAIAYAKQSGDEDPSMAGAKTAISWGFGLAVFALLVGTLIDFITAGVFRTILRDFFQAGGT